MAYTSLVLGLDNYRNSMVCVLVTFIFKFYFSLTVDLMVQPDAFKKYVNCEPDNKNVFLNSGVRVRNFLI